jgi:hypothetical protein
MIEKRFTVSVDVKAPKTDKKGRPLQKYFVTGDLSDIKRKDTDIELACVTPDKVTHSKWISRKWLSRIKRIELKLEEIDQVNFVVNDGL